jgi:hypothetical protein
MVSLHCLRCDEPVPDEEHQTVSDATRLHMRGMQSDVGLRYEARLEDGIERARPDQKVRIEVVDTETYDPVLCWDCWEVVTFYE